MYRQQLSAVDGQYVRLDPAISICAGFVAGNRSLPCEGDSGERPHHPPAFTLPHAPAAAQTCRLHPSAAGAGGPLLHAPTPDPATHIQLGVVSGGAGQCGGPALPAVFSRLDAYRGWVATALLEVDAAQRLPAASAQRARAQVVPLMGRDGG